MKDIKFKLNDLSLISEFRFKESRKKLKTEQLMNNLYNELLKYNNNLGKK